MYKKLLLTIFTYYIYIIQLGAQPFCNIRTFNIRDGLAANIISGIVQTSDDMMWFATWNGLCCYDGYKFTTFRDISGTERVLSTNRLLTIKPNKYNDIWCITYDKQVHLFDTHTCQFRDRTKILYQRFGIKDFTGSVYPLANGFTWAVGNRGLGINFRFNDAQKENEGSIEILKGRNIRKVVLDNNAHEWIFSDKGIERWDNHFKSSILFEYMQQIGNHLYFATTRNQLGCYSKGKITMIPLPPGISHISCITKIGSEAVLLGTNAGILIYHDKSHLLSTLSVKHPNQLSEDVRHLFVDSHKRIWAFTTGKGIIMIDPKNKLTEWLNAQASSPIETTTSDLPFIHQDKHGTIWTIPNNGTFSYYDEKSHQLVAFPLHSVNFGNVSLPHISKSFIDSQNNLWFSGQHDLSIVNFKYHDININTLHRDQEIRAIFSDHRGCLWVGDDKGHILIYNPQEKLLGYLNSNGSIQKQETSFTNKVYAFFEDKQKRMWIGSKGDGLYCLNHGKINHYTHHQQDRYSISHDNIYDIFQDHKGRLWVATFDNGPDLIQEHANGITFIHEDNLLKSFPKAYNKVRRITRTQQGVIILSTGNGIVTFSEQFKNPRDIKFYYNQHISEDSTSLLSSDVLQTYVTKKGNIYVATLGGGLQKIESKNLLQNKLKYKDIKLPVGEEGIFLSMIEDRNGKLWLVRENTLNVFNPTTGETTNFGPNYLNEHTEFSEAKPAYDPRTNRISMGLVGSFISFLPQKIKKNTYSPKIAFINVQFQGEAQSHPILNQDELDVPSDKRNLTITFSALDYNNNDLTQYAYKLEGIDQKWNYVGNSHSASFNNLPSGHHTLIVRSTNSDGVWINNQRGLKIYSHPTFWESGWGWLLYILIFSSIIFVLSYIYTLKERNRLGKEMNEMKTEFFTNIGHKLRTPLTLIGGPVTEILSQNDIKEEYRKALEMVQRNSKSMLELVNNMLNYNSTDNYLVDDINAPIFAQQKTEEKAAEDEVENKDIKLLIVEDNDDLRDFLTSILSHRYQVISAINGKNGLEKAETDMPDFIITDVMMPELDGLEMIRRIKKNPDICHIPIIVLSAKASMEDRIKGLKEGIDDYITKPFSATYLKQRVENIIGQRHILQQTYLEQMNTAEFGKEQIFKLKATEIVDNDKVMIDNLIAFIDEHIGESDLKIEDLANAVNLGRTVFYSKMKSIVGMTPIDFIRHIRIQRAEELVSRSKDNFSQIAYAVGFSDPKYFTKCFKKETGMTPSEYRQKVRP